MARIIDVAGGIGALLVACVFLPMILGAPTGEDALKQQISAGLMRNEDPIYWNMMNPGMRRFNPYAVPHKKFDSLSGAAYGQQKRNFDEIDQSGFGSFVKRNFDEIDHTGLGFNKRNFDEIDRTGFGSFVKRAAV